MRSIAAPVGLVFIVILAGCSTARDVSWPTKSRLGGDYQSVVPGTTPAEFEIIPPANNRESITLRQALSLALLQNQDLAAFGWEIRASEAHVLQASLLPNPEIALEAENLAGTGDLARTGAAEYTIGLSQLIELGSERLRRRNVAQREQDLSAWDYETVRLNIFTETAKSFIRLLASQKRLELADSLRGVAERFYQSVSVRAASGKVSLLDERRAKIELSLSNAERRNAERDVVSARSALAAMWSETTPTFGQAVGNLESTDPVPALQAIADLIQENPDVARWSDEIALRTELVAYQKAVRIPNPTITLGARRLHEIGETGAVAAISIPLSVFDRNQGEIQEAQYRLSQGEALRRSAIVFSATSLSGAHAALLAAEQEVMILGDEVLPAARENLAATEAGYTEGKFDLLMVLDAQRTLFEASNRFLTALELFHSYQADVERLIGTPLNSISTQQ